MTNRRIGWTDGWTNRTEWSGQWGVMERGERGRGQPGNWGTMEWGMEGMRN